MRWSLCALLLLALSAQAQRFESWTVSGDPQRLLDTDEGLLASLHGRLGQVVVFHRDTATIDTLTFGAPPGYPVSQVRLGMCQSTDGSVWAGTSAGYPIRHAPGESTFQWFAPQVPGGDTTVVGCRPTGEVWVIRNGRAHRYTPAGDLLGELKEPGISRYEQRICGCPDGNLWFTATTASALYSLVRLSPSGRYDYFRSPRIDEVVTDMSCASDGGLWFSMNDQDPFGRPTLGVIVRVFPDGRIVEYDVPPNPLSDAGGLAEGPDGAAWFTAYGLGSLARVDDEGHFSFYSDGRFRYGDDMITGRDGKLWFAFQNELTSFTLPPFLQTVPALVGTRGGSGVLYTSDLSVANWGSSTATVVLRYTPSRPTSSVSEAAVTETLLPGRQLVVDDALAWFRSRGFPLPETGNVGTLSVEAESALPWRGVSAVARTTSPSGPGRSGVAYSALRQESLPSSVGSTLRLFGLRQTSSDRTNLALVNASLGLPLRLSVTLVSGDGSGRRVPLPDVFLAPGKWTQLDSVLSSIPEESRFPEGWAEVKSLGDEGASFGAYAVVNDNTTNDGSYVVPSEPSAELIVPAFVRIGAYQSELVLANPSSTAVTAEMTFAPSDAPRRTAAVTLAPMEQRILPRVHEALGLGFGVGPLLVRFKDGGGNAAAGVAFVRVATPEGYGVSLPGTALTEMKASKVRIAGLRQGNGVRSNLALVNAETNATLTLRVTVVDGETGTRKEPMTVTLPPLGFRQLDQVLAPLGIAQGWAEVERTGTTSSTGSGRFVAYGVLNDGERPGEGTGDGSILPMATEK